MYCYMYQYVYISVHFEDGFCRDYTYPSHSITLIKFQVQVAIDYALLLFQYHWNAHYVTYTNTIILYMYIIVIQSCGLHICLLHVYVMHISCYLRSLSSHSETCLLTYIHYTLMFVSGTNHSLYEFRNNPLLQCIEASRIHNMEQAL